MVRRSRCIPEAASEANHTTMTGPKRRPTTPVPRRWIANSRTRIAAAIGTTSSCNDGATTSTPSTAESTEIAGVMMLSPKNSDAPKIPSAASASTALRPASTRRRSSSAISAMIPPSPSLSARMMSATYLMLTMIVIAQNTSEITP